MEESQFIGETRRRTNAKARGTRAGVVALKNTVGGIEADPEWSDAAAAQCASYEQAHPAPAGVIPARARWSS